jgi:hypothetical protein
MGDVCGASNPIPHPKPCFLGHVIIKSSRKASSLLMLLHMGVAKNDALAIYPRDTLW